MKFLTKIKMMKLNYKIIFLVAFFCFCSLITLETINPILSDYLANVDYAQKQFIGMVIALFFGIFAFNIDIKHSRTAVTYIYWFLMVTLFMLAFPIPGLAKFYVNNAGGANAWFQFGTPALSFQPAEFIKIFMILKLADISTIHLKSNSYDSELFKKYLLYAGVPILLVMLEPDLGGAMLLGFSGLIMFLYSIKNEKRLKKYIIGFTLFFGTIVFLAFTDIGQQLLISLKIFGAYQFERLDAWLDPFTTEKGYQLQQSLILMGSAGPFGHGPGFGDIKVSEGQTDLIFVSFVTFWGWIAGIVLILAYFLLMKETIDIGIKQKDQELKLIIAGFAGLFFLQIVENIGMMIGMFPITGIVLPFMSAGLSSVIVYFTIAGLILNISSKN